MADNSCKEGNQIHVTGHSGRFDDQERISFLDIFQRGSGKTEDKPTKVVPQRTIDQGGVFTMIKADPVYRFKFFVSMCLCLAYLGMGLSAGHTGPAFPDLLLIVNKDLATSSWLLTVGAFGYLGGTLIFGMLYDRFNRLLLLFISILGASIGSGTAPWCSLFPLMIAVRIISGIFFGGIDTVSIIIINIFQGVSYVTANAKRTRETSKKSLRFILPAQDGNCPAYREYRDLYNLTDYESCLRGTDLWQPLNDLLGIENLYDCAGIMIRRLGKLFVNFPLVPQHCECLGYFDLHYPEYAYSNYKAKHTCQEQDPAFKDIVQRFYLHEDPDHQNVMISRGRGGTHHSVWQVLSQVSNSECRNILIKNLANTYGGNNTTVTYECRPVRMPLHTLTRPSTMPHTTSTPTTSSKSTTKATNSVHRTSYAHVTTIHTATHFHPVTSSSSQFHTSSTPPLMTKSTNKTTPILHQTTTPAQITHFHTASTNIYSATLTIPTVATIQISAALNTTTSIPVFNISSVTCKKYRLIHDIANELIISSLLTCPSKVYSSDQVPLTYCNSSPVTTTWRPGPKVMDMCQSLPPYIPIATFMGGSFNPIIDIAGIFLGCADNSFKVAVAFCNAKLHIDHVNVTMAPIMLYPDSYHVILS